MIPVYVKTETFSEPDASMYYLVAADGAFLVKKTDLYRSVTRCDRIAGLEPQSPSVTLDVPKLPRRFLERVYGFFEAVYRTCAGEAIVFVFYQPERCDFRIGVPTQTVRRYWYQGTWRTEGHVEYESMSRPQGYLKLGDIHSHGSLSAFFSSVDDLDDREDGLRLVLGRLHIKPPDCCASFVAGGSRFKLDVEAVAEDFGEPIPPPPSWLERVRVRDEPGYVSWPSPSERYDETR